MAAPLLESFTYKGRTITPAMIAAAKKKGLNTTQKTPAPKEYWQQRLSEPVTAEVGLSDRERQAIYNLGRTQLQGATRTSIEQLKEALGGRGFRVGETGVADTAIARLAERGAERLGQYGKEIALQEARDRFGQNLALQEATTQRLGMGMQGKVGLAQAAATGASARLGYQLGKEQLGWEKEKYKEYTHPFQQQQFTYGQEQDAINRLMSLYGLQVGSQQATYTPYWQAMVNTYSQ